MPENTIEMAWRILLVDDDEEEFLLTRERLSESRRAKFKLEWVNTYSSGLAALIENNFDAALIDYDLVTHKGIDLIAEATSNGCTTPMLLLTGHGSFEVDMMAMQAGAEDYLNKLDVTPGLLERSIRYAIERKQSERRFKAQQIEHSTRMQVQKRLLEQREMERIRIARNLHDGPLQDLIGLAFAIQAAINQTPSGEARENLESFRERAKELARELRSVCNELRPPSLMKFGLEYAIRSHSDEFRQNHPVPHIQLDLYNRGGHLPDSVRLALFRIYQESLNNAFRHSQATRVRVYLLIDPSTVVLEIEDDGRGFHLPADWIELANHGHLGLLGMKERAEAVDGALDIRTGPGEGTCVRVTVHQGNH